ncbi:hypothetical protein HDV00_007922 [Rhizophlyctis rosea]|nr:hypothetical protein HDV00_007922 [Rhizophlyctis rosea]
MKCITATLITLLPLLTITTAAPALNSIKKDATNTPSDPIDITTAAATNKTKVYYDNIYDDGSTSTKLVACSDGKNGLYTAGYKTLGDLPNFPYVGASFRVAGWNSPNCGKCYQLNWKENSIYVTAVDSTRSGFVLSQEAMDELTDGQAVDLGEVTATWKAVGGSKCGFDD